MKKHIIIIFTFFSINLNAYDLDYFKLLNIEEQIQYIIYEFQHDQNWPRSLALAQYSSILADNPTESIPVLLDVLTRLEMVPRETNDFSFDIIHRILYGFTFTYRNILDIDQKTQLITILQNKLINYLNIHNVIDVTVVLVETTIQDLLTNQYIISYPNVGQIIYDKYYALGFTNLTITYIPVNW